MLFHFRLKPVEQIHGWGDEGVQSLHWFGLTDGESWIDTGTAELFRYTDEMVAHRVARGDTTRSPHNDYYVIRLWEDVLHLLPAVMEPVPAEVLRLLRPGLPAVSWSEAALERGEPGEPGPGEDEWYDLVDTATGWMDARRLDTGYLVSGPRIWLWRGGNDTVTLHWDNRGLRIGGIPAWAATAGTTTMPAERFLAEVRDFDRRLMDAMAERVEQVRRHWPHPAITLDVDQLAREHQARARSVTEALARAPDATDWPGVLAALERLSRIHPLPG